MDTGTAIAIELDVPGVDKTLANLRRVADELKKLQAPGRIAQSAAFDPNARISFPAGGGNFAAPSRMTATVTAQAKAAASASATLVQMGRAAGISGTLLAAMVNPVTATIAAIGLAVTAVAAMTSAAVEAGKALRDIGLTSGGTRFETTQLSVFGNALGVQMGQLSREFADRIAHDGAAAGFAARSGIHDYGTFGDVDKAKNLLKWIQALRSMSPDESKRAARATGTESLLPTRNYSDQQMQSLQNDAATKSRIFDPKFLQDAQDFQLELARVGDAFTNLIVSILKPLVPDMVKSLKDMADSLNDWANAVNNSANKVVGFFQIMKGVLEVGSGVNAGFGMKDIFDGIAKMRETNIRRNDRHADALDRHTDAMNENTYALRNGIFGGGDRARGAVPSKWMGMNADRYTGEAARLGAFAL